MRKIRYFDTKESAGDGQPLPFGVHTEFLRTGRINRERAHWLASERRYLSHEEVAEQTGRKLEAAGLKTHERINTFHPAIRFPQMVFHRTFADVPHLGYCHVTGARAKFAQYEDVRWAFYIANFYAALGDNDNFFGAIDPAHHRMYFAVAMTPGEETPDRLVIDRSVRGNGVLFQTHDPQVAIRNVLLLGARNEQLRDIIRQL